MWNKGKPGESAIVVVGEITRKGMIRDSIAVYDENEGVFFRNGEKLKEVKQWRYKGV